MLIPRKLIALYDFWNMWLWYKVNIHFNYFISLIFFLFFFFLAGCGLTTGALCYGLWSFRTGNIAVSQKMMFLRIAGQGFTVAALMLGVLTTAMKDKMS